MTPASMASVSRAEERAAQRSAAVQRSRTRIANQVRLMLDAALRLIQEKGDSLHHPGTGQRGRCRTADVLPLLRQQG